MGERRKSSMVRESTGMPYAQGMSLVATRHRYDLRLSWRFPTLAFGAPGAISSGEAEDESSLAFIFLSQAQDAETTRRAATPPDWLMKAKKLVQQRACEGFTIAEIAYEVAIHPVHLATEFRRFFGLTICEFARRIKLDLAKKRLVGSDDPVAEIALETGFYDQAHLTRVFRSRFGMPPAKFRAYYRRS